MSKYIGILGTLDTKSEYIYFVQEEIKKRGHIPIIMDLSMGSESKGRVDVTPEEIAKAGGMDIKEVRASSERNKITKVMTLGAMRKANELYFSGKLDAIMALGGLTASGICSRVMQGLPFGLPKFIVSSAASSYGMASRFLGSRDITLMYSMVDFVGLNRLLQDVLVRSAGAICGMAEAATGVNPTSIREGGKRLVAMTVMGGVDKCAHYVIEQLKSFGYEGVTFAAFGYGEMAMEDLIRDGFFDFVIDLCPGAVGEEMFGGTRAAGPTRLEAAGEKGIPEIIAPSAANVMTPAKSKYKPEYATRKKLDIDELRTWIRLSPEEMRAVAKVFAEKVNKAKGKVKFLIPLQGWSSLDREGSPIYDPEMDRIFTEELKKYLKPEIEVREVDANIDDLKFAQTIISTFKEMK